MDYNLLISYGMIALLGFLIMLFGLLLTKKQNQKLILGRKQHVTRRASWKIWVDSKLDNIWFIVNQEARYQEALMSSNLELTARKVTKYQLICVFVGLGIAIFLKNIYISIPLVIVLYNIPWKIISGKIAKHEKLLNNQVLDSLQTFVTDFSVTKSVPNSVYNMTLKTEDPIKQEWDRLSRGLNSGLPYQDCFNQFANRINNKWARIYAQIMITYYEQGNDFSEQLLNLTQKITDEKILQQENQTEMGAMLGVNYVLNIAVPIVYVANRFAQPEASQIFTNTETGRLIIFVIFSLMLLSMYLGQKIADW